MYSRTARMFGYLVAITQVACSQPATRVSNPAIPSRMEVPAPDTTTSRSLQSAAFDSGTMTYLYQSSATIESVMSDSLSPRIDSVQTTAVVTTRFSVLNSRASATVTIDSARVLFTGATAVARSPEVWPNEVHQVAIEQRTGHTTTQQSARTCTQEARDFPLRGEEVIPTIPIVAPVATSWTDTVTREICRGGVALRVHQTARYKLEQLADSSALYRIIRATESQVTGEGSQWQQPVQANGRGVATDTFTVTRPSMRISEMRGMSRLEVTFKSTYRDQRFVQTAQTQITARQD